MKRLFGNVASVLGLLLVVLPSSRAAQLKEARVTQIVSDVKLLPQQAAPRPAAVNDPVREGTAVRTGTQSRSELTFTDQTITRLGANTIFSFDEGTRTMNLRDGAILFQVPKGSGGATIRTAAVTAAITGTTGIGEYHPASAARPRPFSKWLCLEGTFHLTLPNGQSVVLGPGKMVTTSGENFSKVMNFDIAQVMKSSLLVTGFTTTLASQPLIQIEQERQLALKESEALLAQNTFDLLDPSTLTDTVEQARTAEEAAQSSPSGPSVPPTPSKFGAPSTIASNPYVISGATTIQTDPTITTNGQTNFGTIWRGPAEDGPLSAFIFGSTSAFDSQSGFDDELNGNMGGAGFKFTSLQLIGNPTISTANGEINLGLIAVNGITSGGPGGTLTFAGIRGLLLATQNGSIDLGSELSFAGLHDITFYARGSGSTLNLAADVSTSSKIRLYAEGGIQLSSDLSTQDLIAFTGGDFDFTGGSINAETISIISGGDLHLALSSSLDIGGDLSLTTRPRTIGSGGIITVTNPGEAVIGGALTLLVDNSNRGRIATGGNISFTTGGGLTANSIDALINNRNGGSIGSGGNMIFNIGGALTTTGDASFITSNRNDGRGGGTIGSNVVLTLNAASFSIGGFLDVDISTNAGGHIPSARLTVNVAGDLVAQGGAIIDIQNTGFTNGANGDPIFLGGGIIDLDAIVSLSAGNVSSGDFFQTAIFNNGDGKIGRDAIVEVTVANDIAAQGGAFFGIFNNADASSGAPGGFIGRNAAVNVNAANISSGAFQKSVIIINNLGGNIVGDAIINFNASGDMSAQAGASFEIFNVTGVIGSDAAMNVSAANITGGIFLAQISDYTSGSIGGNALIDFSLSGNISIQGDATFAIDSGFGGGMGTIGGNATIDVNAANVNADNSLSAFILNYDGAQIAENAVINFGLSGDITTQGGADIQIFNTNTSGTGTGGTIGGNATINLSASAISGSLFPQIENQFGGAIGGNATINVNVASILSTATDGLFGATIANYDGGSIGGSALINIGVSGDIDAPGEVEFSILNNDIFGGGGGTIGSDATIDVSCNNISTDGVLFAQIRNDGGGNIGGNATININISGSVTVTSDASFEISGSDNAAAAAINLNDGSYDAGGTFLAFIDGDGTIAFNNVTAHADVLKVGAFGANGMLNISGGTLSADTTLKLYATGSNGQLNFIDNVTLGGNGTKILAANSVTISNGKTVTIGGSNPADVYTNNANYSGSGGNSTTSGTFGGAGANTPQPLSNAPPFDVFSIHPLHGSSTAKANSPTHSHARVPSEMNRSGRAKPAGAVINVSDSGQLLSLLDRTASAAGKQIMIPPSKQQGHGRHLGRKNNVPDRLVADRGRVDTPGALNRLRQ